MKTIIEQYPTALELQLKEVVEHHNLGKIVAYEPISNGLINATWRCDTPDKKLIVQRLSSQTPPESIQNYRVVCEHLNSDGIVMAKQIDMPGGQPYSNCLDEVFRVFEFVHNTSPRLDSETTWRSAGHLLGRVHDSLSRLNYTPVGTIPGFHDALQYRQRIKDMGLRFPEKFTQVASEAEYISKALDDSIYFSREPKQVIHGDPKLLNFLFDDEKAIMLIDWDACMRGSVGIDLGDSLRSLCRTSNNEYDSRREKVFTQGYACSKADFDIKDTFRTRKAVSGQIIEAAARYLIDYFEGNYFSYPTHVNASAENLSRARKGVEYHLSFKRETAG